MNISDRFHIVPVLSDGDLNAGATLDGDTINMKSFLAALFVIGLQILGVASSHVKVFSGATAGAKTTALTFRYRFGSAAAGSATADVYTAWATSADLTLTHGTYDGFTLLIEVDAAEMNTALEHEWLTIEFSDPDTGSTGNVQVHAVLEPRYASTPFATAIG